MDETVDSVDLRNVNVSVGLPASVHPNSDAAIYVAGPTALSQGICWVIADAPSIPGRFIEAAPLPAPEEGASSASTRLPLFALSTALLLISFGNAELLQTYLTAIVDLST